MAVIVGNFLQFCLIGHSGLRFWSSPSLLVTSCMVMKRYLQEALSQALDEYLGERF